MSALEEKKIVIKLPQLHWNMFLSVRFFLMLGLILFSASFAYWYHSIRPFFWIHSARVEAFSTVVSTDMPGRIIEIGPQEGEMVKRGQTLFVLDRDLILAKQAQAQLILNNLVDQIESEKSRIGKAMEEYLTASSELELGIGSSDVVKKHLAAMEDAQRKSESANAQLHAAQIELSQLDLQVKKMTLTAPFDGVVLKRFNNEGAVVSFAEPVYIVCDPKRTWIEAEVPENKIGQIAIGTPVRIQLPAHPNKELSGSVSYIGPATVAKSSLISYSGENATIPIKVFVDGAPSVLKPGLSAHVGLKIH